MKFTVYSLKYGNKVGYFKTLKLAYQAYKKASKEYHGKFSNNK